MTRDELILAGWTSIFEEMGSDRDGEPKADAAERYFRAALSAIEESGLVIVNRKSLESVYEAAKLSEPIIDALIKEMSPNG